MNVIGKMRLISVEDYGYSRKFKFSAVHDAGINTGDSPENKAFTKATPSGEMWMVVDNQYVWPAFRLPGNGESESTHYVILVDAKEHNLSDVHRALAALESSDAE